jgi:peptidoglycan/LPS O-acetylase OafA/YrhL
LNIFQTRDASKDTPEGKLQSVEIVRFLAAFAVIVWHYQFYFFEPAMRVPGFRESLPLSGLLSIFYNSGWHAVEWFWVLSGYIFFFNYRDVLESRKMTAFTFFSRRFARLYPLNIATLFIVAALLAFYVFLFKNKYPMYTKPFSFLFPLCKLKT